MILTEKSTAEIGQEARAQRGGSLVLHGVSWERYQALRWDLLKALEPDLCYWVTNLEHVREKDVIDLTIDPPPDLALEVDVTRQSIPKLPIYQALKVPEVWRWHNGLDIRCLDNSGNYIVSTESSVLPGFPFKLAEEFIQRRHKVGENALVEQFEKAIAKLI